MSVKNTLDLTLIETPEDFEAEYHSLRNKLRDSNISKIGEYSKNKPLLSLYYDHNKKMVGGVYAYLCLGMLFIDLLWVDESYRGQQLGTYLLEHAEKFAKDNGALYI